MEKKIRFTCAARPQCAKMCFLLHKLTHNSQFETWTVKMTYRRSQNIDFAQIPIDLARAARPQCAKKARKCFYYIKHDSMVVFCLGCICDASVTAQKTQ